MEVTKRLIEGCKAGKQNAFSELYRLCSSPMLGVCFRYCRNREEAEDVLQEGFIKVFKYISGYRGEGSFEGWIRRIMVNTALNHYRSNIKISNTIEYDDSKHDVAEDETITIDDKLKPEMIFRQLQNLPDGYRMVFNMYVLEGLTHKEIADELGIAENTSKSQLSKARKMLRKLLNRTP